MSHYISFQQTRFCCLPSSGCACWLIALGFFSADRKINTLGSSPGQPLSRIHHDSRQQPEVVSAVPDLVHLPRGDGSPLLVLPKSVELCGVKSTQSENEVVLSSLKPDCRCLSFLGLRWRWKIILAQCCFCAELQSLCCFYLLSHLFRPFHLSLLIFQGLSSISITLNKADFYTGTDTVLAFDL